MGRAEGDTHRKADRSAPSRAVDGHRHLALTARGAYGRPLLREPAVNRVIRTLALMLAASALLLLAGCVTPGGYGGYPGGVGQPAPGYPSGGYPSTYGNQMEGTVVGLDPSYDRILVDAYDPRTGRTQRMELRYDQRTRLFYQGRELAVEGLERGDVIRFDAVQSGREWWVRQIEVVRDVRQGGSGYGGAYGNELRGSVAYVDTRNRTIRLDGAGYGSNAQVIYDARTTVEYQGRSYRPENLERGDLVRIQARQVGSGQWLAERIIVERSVSY